jgi:hypothetical protein
MESKLKVHIPILITLLFDFPHKLQHFTLELFVEQQIWGGSRRIEESDWAMSRHFTRYRNYWLMRKLMLDDAVSPEVGLTGADQ